MRLPRPRSLTSLMILGLLMVLVPAAFALTQAVIQLQRLAGETDTLVRQGVELAGGTQSLFRHLSAYDRATNLYLLLGDPRLLEASHTTQQQITATAERLASLTLTSGAAAVDTTALRQAAVGAVAVLEFADPAQVDRSALLASRLAQLNAAAGELTDRANQVVEARLRQLASQAVRTRRQLYLWMVALIPVALALAVAFTLGVLRPLRRVDRAITELGHGSMSQPIAIKGSSDIVALGRQLEWLRVRLLELAQEKNRFLRYMSHELKTPLANIREGTDLLLDETVGKIGPEQREVTDIMRQNALRLQQLIENLLSYSAWQTQSTKLEISSFSLGGLLSTCLLSQKLTIAARRIRVARDVEDVTLKADRAKIRLVFDNLLSNAVKFTPDGGTITVRARRAGHGFVVDFADSGPGIPPQERQRVFEPFYTGSTPQTGPLKGSGIGLSIVAEFVAAHGGKVELVQGEFTGAHFRLVFPRAMQVEESHELRARA